VLRRANGEGVNRSFLLLDDWCSAGDVWIYRVLILLVLMVGVLFGLVVEKDLPWSMLLSCRILR